MEAEKGSFPASDSQKKIKSAAVLIGRFSSDFRLEKNGVSKSAGRKMEIEGSCNQRSSEKKCGAKRF